MRSSVSGITRPGSCSCDCKSGRGLGRSAEGAGRTAPALQPAGRAAVADLERTGSSVRTAVERVRAARMKAAARGRPRGIGHLAGQRLGQRARSRRDEARHRSAPRCRDAAAADQSARVGPVSTITPRYMTETTSATWRTIARSCEISSRLSESSRERSTRRFATCACADASSDASGSSRTSTDGSAASARAIAIRCRWPPLNWCG